jgi:hypothetical protein
MYADLRCTVQFPSAPSALPGFFSPLPLADKAQTTTTTTTYYRRNSRIVKNCFSFKMAKCIQFTEKTSESVILLCVLCLCVSVCVCVDLVKRRNDRV